MSSRDSSRVARIDPLFGAESSCFSSLPNELLVRILSLLTFQEKAVSRRVCMQWRDVVHDLLAKQQQIQLGSFQLDFEHWDPDKRWKHEVSWLNKVPDSLLESGRSRLIGNSLMVFIGKYCPNLIMIEMGQNWNKHLNVILKSHGKRIECLKTQITDLRLRHLCLLLNIRELECKRICYRETGNLFEICPKIRSVICARMNYDSLYAIPAGVHVYDEGQRDRYQAFEDGND